MPTIIRAKVTLRLKWQGERKLRQINRLAVIAVKEAGEIYEKELTRTLKSAPWGSKPATEAGPSLSNLPSITGRTRIRFRHSSPGEVPYRQTLNLANSVRLTSQTGSGATLGEFRSRVSTRVKYSRTLERGLPQISVPQSSKRFTDIRLLNPLKLKPGTIIAPRPVWVPVFEKTRAKMIKQIASTMSRI